MLLQTALQRLIPWLATPPIKHSQLFLFGGTSPWTTPTDPWIAIDDRVRGGSSQSHLTPLAHTTSARFSGTLDTKTLGGAGFASQATNGSRVWDLSAYDGIEVQLLKGDGKIYTLIVKDDVPERREDGREAAGVSWEFDFEVPLGKEVGAGGLGEEVGMGGGGGGGGGAGGEGEVVWMPWAGFKATYRGREFRGAKPLRTNEITRFSLMMRSFFDKQEGAFELDIASISAVRRESPDS